MQPLYVIQRSYDDFDDLVSEAREWDLELCQIDRGKFHGELLQFGNCNTHIAEARFGRALVQKGAPPAGLRTLGIPANQQVKFIWRGQQVCGSDLLIFPLGAELESVSSPSFHVYTCSFPEELLRGIGERLEIDELDDLRGTSEVIRCRPDLMDHLQNQLRRLCELVRREQASLHEIGTRSQFTVDLPRRLLLAIAASQGVYVPATSSKRNLAVVRAQTFIERHARDSISVMNICDAAGVSQRTLEYAFRERFGMTPKAYLQVHRLNLVRRELRATDPSTAKISDIANDHEFWHLGRFAADYRQLFQELPSETLQRNAPCAHHAEQNATHTVSARV